MDHQSVRELAVFGREFDGGSRLDQLPVMLFVGHPAGRGQDSRLTLWIRCVEQVDDALAAVDRGPEAAGAGLIAGSRSEVCVDSVVEGEHGGDLISGHGADGLGRLADMGGVHLMSVAGDVRKDPLGIAQQHPR